MIAELGHAALWLAAALALLQLVLAITGRRDAAQGLGTARALALGQGGLALVAFACLLLVFARTDLSVLLVATNSHSAKPFLYKVAGAWGNHEGSMLLWVTVLASSGALVAMARSALAPVVRVATLAAQSALALGFYAFLLTASNPFARLVPAAAEGRGLNPLLQDPGLTFHPPTLYIGYVGLSVAFSMAVGAMLNDAVDERLARAMRPWVLGAWMFLTLGITAGSWWAYYELGWGGWWFWDPVENASLMPWLAATALLHSVSVLAARGALRAWTMMLALVAFSMSMVGTFLVRSGILTSVHAFAVDPTRGGFILALLAIYVGAALALFGLKIASVRDGAPFAIKSRESGLVINNLLLSVILGIVFIGTLYPLIAEAMSGEKLSVGPPYFNAVTAPLALLLAALLLVGPLLRWRRHETPLAARLVPALLTALVVLVASMLLVPSLGLWPRLGLAAGLALVPGSLMPLARRRPWRAPLTVWAMCLAHLGVGIAMVGMAAESGFTRETLALARPGDRLSVGPWLVEFRDVSPTVGANFTALEAELRVTRGDGVEVMRPSLRFFADPPTETSEAALATYWDGQLYTVLGKRSNERDGWQLRLWWKPFVPLIWLGGMMIAMGGALSLLGRALATWRQRRRERQEREDALWAA